MASPQDPEYAPEVLVAVLDLMDRGVDEVRTAQRVNCRYGVYYSPAEVLRMWRTAVQNRQLGKASTSDGSAYHSRCSEHVINHRA